MRILSVLLLSLPLGLAAASDLDRDLEIEPIDDVWSGTDVPFALAVNADRVAVAYYDADRWMTVASRSRESTDWQVRTLPSQVGWDSHNALALAFDQQGRLHLAGNMHNDPLVYFRTDRAGDIASLRRIARMVSRESETQLTYPQFLRDAAGNLVFSCRVGGSGNGNTVFNVYDGETQTWSRLNDSALIDGQGQRSAYVVGPVAGPDGDFHITWVWRDTPDAGTNHDLSYARSPDLRHWETSTGKPLSLPMTIETAEVVDPVSPGAGMINNNTLIGFDRDGRVLIAYHKFDNKGQTQVYVARRESSGWSHYQLTKWDDFRWDFGGWGSLDFRLRLYRPYSDGDGNLVFPVARDGKAIELVATPDSLQLERTRPRASRVDQLADRIAVPDGMRLNTVSDDSGLMLAWASLPANRDRPQGEIPEPTTLYLVMPARSAMTENVRRTMYEQ